MDPYVVFGLRVTVLFDVLTYSTQLQATFVPATYAHHLQHWGRFNMKVASYQYRNSHYAYKTVSRLCHIYNRNPYTG